MRHLHPEVHRKTFGGHPMRKCHIYTMLANPLYAARIRAADEIVAATHPRIVDDNTFDLVQQKLKENTRNPGAEHRPKLEALLRGLLYCSGCGSATQQAHTQPVVVEIPEPICLSL